MPNTDPNCKYILSARQHKITARAGPPLSCSTCTAIILQIPECSAIIFVHQSGQDSQWSSVDNLKLYCSFVPYKVIYCVVLRFSLSMFSLKKNVFGSRRKGFQDFLDYYHFRPTALFKFWILNLTPASHMLHCLSVSMTIQMFSGFASPACSQHGHSLFFASFTGLDGQWSC